MARGPYFEVKEIGNLVGTIEQDKKQFTETVWETVKARGEDLKKKLRADFKASGMRNAARVSKSWPGGIYPSSKNKLARNPAYFLQNREPYFATIFQTGGIVRAPGGGWLVVPIGEARKFKLPLFKGHYELRKFMEAKFGGQLTARNRNGHTLLGIGLGAEWQPLFLLKKEVQVKKMLHSNEIFAAFAREFDAQFFGDVINRFETKRARRA